MPQNRREFLGVLARASVVGLSRSGLAGAIGHVLSQTADAAPVRPQAGPFRGRRPGEERVVDGIRMCWCPPGQFVMGSPPDEAGHRADEDQVPVTLTRGFWTAKTEVTQGEWGRMVGAFPDRPPTSRFGLGDDVPMYWVSFYEAEEFCAELTRRARQSGALPRQWQIRLPTEAQWEYACRAGTRTATAFGDGVRLREVNFNGVWENPDRRAAPRTGSARPVGSYPANAWGIHEMHGNVWEWCRDWYRPRLPGGVDPDLYDLPGRQNRDGTYSRVRRGGAWIEDGWACRSACRLPYEPPRRSDHIGFRVVAVEGG